MRFARILDLPSRAQWQQWARAAARAAWRRPPVVTLALIACIVVTFARLQVGLHLPGLTFVQDAFSGRALVAGNYHVLMTSTLLTRDVFMVVSISLSLLVTMGTYEIVAGHARAALLAVVAAALGPILVAGGLGLLFALGSTWADARLDTLDIGASAIVAASSAALAGIARDRRLTIGLMLFLLGGLLVHHQLADWEHVLIFPIGYLAGRAGGRARVGRRRIRKRAVALYALTAACLVACGVQASSHLLPSPHAYHDQSGTALSQPRLVTTTYPSPSMGESRPVIVLLPAGYDSTTRRYPVIELLHGDPGAADTMIAVAHIQQSAAAPGVAPFIGIAPDGHGPRIAGSWFANSPGQAMGTAVSHDLRVWAEHTFRTNGQWSYAGLSSGGFAAAYLPLIDPEPVHASCGLSGYYGGAIPPLQRMTRADRARYTPLAQAARAPSLVFLADGSGDKESGPQLAPYLAALQAAHKRVVAKLYPGGHTFYVWQEGYLDCFRAVSPAG